MGVDGGSRRRAEEKEEEQKGREEKAEEISMKKFSCTPTADIFETVASLTFNHLLC